MDLSSHKGPTTRDARPSLDDLSVEGRVQLASLERRLFDAPSEPIRLGRFTILDVLGRGAMGTVYRAYDPELDRRVAIKLLSSTDDHARTRVRREATALARLAHPNIVTIHEVGEDDAGVFVAMEYVDGGTLDGWCEAHPEPSRHRTRQLLDFALQAIDGLIAAHHHGLVHRDIKPANMLIGTDGRLRLADFGLARPAVLEEIDAVTLDGSAERTASSRASSFAGTPAYMPPEQFEGVADARSDQFSLCASLFEAFYGVRPYRANSVPELLEAFEQHRVTPIGGRFVPGYVFTVLRQGLRPDPSLRHEDMQALKRALQTAIRRRTAAFGGSGGLALLGLVGGAFAMSQPAPCRPDHESIRAVVDEHDPAVERALATSGVPYADETWERASQRLEQIVRRYANQSLEACRTARHPDPERAAVGQRRTACLEQARIALDEALASAHRLDARRARSFADFTDFLLDVTDCDDVSAELYDSSQGQRLLGVYRRGQIAQQVFDPSLAQRTFETILAQTQPGQLPRLRSSTHLRLSELAKNEGRDEDFRRHTMEALDEALAAGDVELTALGWLHAAELVPEEDSWDTVQLFLGRAARLEASGELSQRTLAGLDHERARLHLRRGDSVRAIEFIRRAIDRAKRIHHPLLPYMFFELTTMSLYEGDVEGALAAATRAREGLETRLGPHHPEVGAVLLRIAEAQGFAGREEDALETLERSIELFSAAPEYNAANLATAHASRGVAQQNLGSYDRAIADFRRSLEIEFEPPQALERHRLRTRTDLARTLSLAERHEAALRELDAVLPELDAPADLASRSAHADALVLRARILADLERDEESARQLQAARPVVEATFLPDSVPRVQSMLEIADVQGALGMHDDALTTLEPYLAEDSALDPVWRGRAQAQRAFVHEQAGDDAAALEWARRALDRLDSVGYSGTESDQLREILARFGP